MSSNDAPLFRVLDLSFAEALARVPLALKSEGFGILTSIDVQATMKAKLGADLAPYTILGACNPKMAFEALGIDPTVGVNLPCNVVVRELGERQIEVRAVDPVQTIAGAGRSNLTALASQVREMLARAIASV